jgi:hypothetical protein
MASHRDMTEPPMPSLTGILRALGRWATIRILLAALLLAAVCWYFGADVSHSILIGSAVTTLGLIFSIANENPAFSDSRWQSDSHTNEQGARRDIAQLSRSLRGSYGRVGYGVVTRAQRLARQRLAPYQLDLLNPADGPGIEQLIGHHAYAVLVRGERRPPFLRSFIQCLNALDALDPTKPITLRSGSRRWSREHHRERPEESA